MPDMSQVACNAFLSPFGWTARLIVVATALGTFNPGEHGSIHAAELLPPVQSYASSRIAEFSQIPEKRRTELKELSAVISEQLRSRESVDLIYICTHNSRRSHLCQVWSEIAATYYRIGNTRHFSGGTMATACHPHTVEALKRLGLEVERSDQSANPVYQVKFSPVFSPVSCFSKTYSASPNPSSNFIAVMTCSDADKGCPVVAGASARFALMYDDPRISDGTPSEHAIYDERCRQIAREQFFLFSQVSRTIQQPAK
jgi:arsenate reductase